MADRIEQETGDVITADTDLNRFGSIGQHRTIPDRVPEGTLVATGLPTSRGGVWIAAPSPAAFLRGKVSLPSTETLPDQLPEGLRLVAIIPLPLLGKTEYHFEGTHLLRWAPGFDPAEFVSLGDLFAYQAGTAKTPNILSQASIGGW